VHESLIGIFYLINGRIVSESVPLRTIRPSGGVRTYPRQHYELWSKLQKKDPDLYDLDCYALPRGRVLYNEKTRKFQILADRHVLKRDQVIDRILKDFRLEKSDVEFREDEHYRCAVCKKELELL
jgi:hypothetical protein